MMMQSASLVGLFTHPTCVRYGRGEVPNRYGLLLRSRGRYRLAPVTASSYQTETKELAPAVCSTTAWYLIPIMGLYIALVLGIVISISLSHSSCAPFARPR